MSEGTPPVLPPVSVPPRPDRPEPSRVRLVAAFVFVLLLALVLGGLAATSLLREPADPGNLAAGSGATPSSSPAPTGTSSPTATTSPRSRVDGAFRFLERAAGGAPVRWNPCETITYAVNTRGATSPVRPDLKEALRRVTLATRVEFKSVGTTRESFIRAYLRMRYEGVIRKAELILIWVEHADYEAILRRLDDPRPSVAFAKTMAGLYAHRDQYFGGIIVMDADATSARGFGYRYAHGSVLLHELGHVMGLDHVKDPDELMYSGHHPNFSVRDFGSGDLEGLRRVGMEAGCLD
jgi:hypothetical protein